MFCDINQFDRVFMVDTEFQQLDGERPSVHCVVTKDADDMKEYRYWTGSGHEMPDYLSSPRNLIVCYSASAEWQAFEAIGWDVKCEVLDLWVVFRCLTNGLPEIRSTSQIAALNIFGMKGCSQGRKENMRALAMRGAPFTEQEKADLLEYCAQDVEDLAHLFVLLRPFLDLGRDLLRSRYVLATAEMESVGIPIDVEYYEALVGNLEIVKKRLIERLDEAGIYDDGSFRLKRFEALINELGTPWPRTHTGQFQVDRRYFRNYGSRCEILRKLGTLRNLLSKLQRFKLPIGKDGRCRTNLRPFASKTGRNQPSSTKFVFGLPRWMRGLVKAPDGKCLVYIDFSQQELAVAAALSGDNALQDAYISGDPYLEFGKAARLIPRDATKESHGREREIYKQVVLGVQYGMGARTLAEKTSLPIIEARNLLKEHRRAYPDFWRWSDGAPVYGHYYSTIHTAFGWRLNVSPDTKPTSLQNFPCQANGAEILRIACLLLRENHFKVLCTVHDAVLLEIDDTVVTEKTFEAQSLMEEASRLVLGGFSVSTDYEIVRPGERFLPDSGEARDIWNIVDSILTETQHV